MASPAHWDPLISQWLCDEMVVRELTLTGNEVTKVELRLFLTTVTFPGSEENQVLEFFKDLLFTMVNREGV